MIGVSKLDIDASGDYEVFTVEFPCRRVTFREEDGAATFSYRVKAPSNASETRLYAPGEPCVLEQEGGFMVGSTPARFATSSGSGTLDVLYE